MQVQMPTFKSPQTKVLYNVVTNIFDFALVAFRHIGEGRHRVRIQSDKNEVLSEINSLLTCGWGVVKDDDHLSIVVEGEAALANALGDAVKATVKLALDSGVCVW